MNQQKPNRKIWRLLGLTMLLSLALLISATGTAFARYRAEREQTVKFEVRIPDQVFLGTVRTDTKDDGQLEEVFEPVSQLVWKTENGVTQLEFAVANGTDWINCSVRDQKVRLRMIGTLGIWMGSGTPKLSMVLPPEKEGEEEFVVEATVVPLVEGTALYHTYGEGWIYTFLDEKGEELFWELPGEQLSYEVLTVTINGDVPGDLSLLQPYVIAEPME